MMQTRHIECKNANMVGSDKEALTLAIPLKIVERERE